MNSSPPPIHAAPASSGLATASMVCGILAIPTCFATALPAIIMGHIASSNARKEGRPAGHAKVGLILGYGSLLLIPLIAVIAGLTAPIVIRQREKADMTDLVSRVRQIGLALGEFEAKHGEFPKDLKDLESENLVSEIDPLLELRLTKPDDVWLYNPNAKPSEKESTLLLSPAIGSRRVILRVDNSVTTIPKNETIPGSDTWISIPAPSRNR